MTTFKKSHRCYSNHPALDVGGGKMVHGGSCFNPIKNADIYVGLGGGMERIKDIYPWNEHKVIAIPFDIADGFAPDDKPEFKKMIHWLSGQIDAGKKVHVGCVGGHGRTGTVLAALVAYRKTADDPIAYVREHYCKKAVETKNQIDFLVDYWGCKEAKPRERKGVTYTSTLGEFTDYSSLPKIADYAGKKYKSDKFIDSGTPMRGKDKTVWTESMIYQP